MSAGGSRLFLGIPARLGSTRLPRKPLQRLDERTIVEHVALRAHHCARSLRAAGVVDEAHVFVATDSPEVRDVLARETPVEVVLTPASLESGTDRVHAALQTIGRSATSTSSASPVLRDDDLVVNLQGDEPFFCERDLSALVRFLVERRDLPMATLVFERTDMAAFLSSSVVKVVRANDDTAVTFSRAPVPWPRETFGASGHGWLGDLGARLRATADKGDESGEGSELSDLTALPVTFLQHVGVYGFRLASLRAFAMTLERSALERVEGLEQLRALAAGWRIGLVQATDLPFGIDTPDDLERARALLETRAREKK